MSPEPKPVFSPHLIRVIVLIGLVIVAQIPIWMLGDLIRERQTRRDAAIREVGSKWGVQQTITGPLLVVPYVVHVPEVDPRGATTIREEHHQATFLPERLTMGGRLDAEARRRGIFSVPVYRSSLVMEAAFARPSFSGWGVSEADIDWKRAQIVLGMSDVRALEAPTAIEWSGGAVELLPGPGDAAPVPSGVHADVAWPAGASELTLRAPLQFKGSAGLYWTALGKTTVVTIRSNAPSPSFQGNWLPGRHVESAQGFQAEWRVPYLGRNFPQSWRDDAVSRDLLQSASFGVDLIESVDHYRMAERSVKYAGLFLLLTFATLWLVEVLCAVRVHPVPYLLIGCAMCVFYLLELSLSEHLGFGLSYLVATAAIVAQIGAYSVAVLKTAQRAAIVAGMVAALYGYLYVVLTNEDYALLIGSIGVFALLAVIMRLTRRVDWYGAGSGPTGTSAERRAA
jgi:inner membrane protein